VPISPTALLAVLFVGNIVKYKSIRISLPLGGVQYFGIWANTEVLSQYKSIEVEYKSIESNTKVIQANLDRIFLIPVSICTSWGIKTG
jgi:hypothetical protein